MAYNYVPRMSSTGLLTLPYYNGPPNPFKPLRVRYYEVDANGTTHHGECTTYAYGRWLEIANGDVTKLVGLFGSPVGTRNGGAWVASSPSLYIGKTNPQPGDILCLRQGEQQNYWGHVAVVEEVHFDYIVTSESEHSDDLFDIVTRMKSLHYLGQSQYGYYVTHGYTLQGFLRMRDVPSPPTHPDFNMPTEWVHYPSYTSMTQEDKDNNAVMAWVQLKSYGWTLEAICGAIGNFCRESNLDPQATGTGGGGLVGWTPLSNLTRWTNYYGYTWYDGEKQIEFIDMGVYCSGYDGQGDPVLAAQWLPGRVGGLTYTEYKQMTDTPENMAKLFMNGYEAPGIPALTDRQYWARYYYDFLIGLDFPGSSKPYKHKMPVWMMAQKPYTKLIY